MKKYDTSIAIQILPKIEEKNLISVIDEVIAHLKSSGYPVFVGPFETTVEGDFLPLMELIQSCQHLAIKKGAEGVMSYIKINYQPNKGVLTIDEKTKKYRT